MLSSLLLKRDQLRVELRALEARIDQERTTLLAGLPQSFGFSSFEAFARAVREAAPRPEISRGRPRSREALPLAPVIAPSRPVSPPGLAAAQKADTPIPAPTSPRPTGASLDDPANFGLLPDRTLLNGDLGRSSPNRARLIEALKFAQRVLHTSRVPAVTWREWRDFERKATEALSAALTSTE